MKQFKFLTMAAVALMTGFTSCNNNEDLNIPEGDGVLVVNLPDDVVSRAVENTVTTGGTTVLADVTVFLLNGNLVVGAPVDFTAAEIAGKHKRIEQVSSTVGKVLVVANIPASEKAALVAKTNAADIKAFAFTIANQNVAGNGISNKTLMGEGTAVTAIDPNPDAHVYKEADVTLNSLTARIEVGAVKAGTGVANVELVGVWVNNFYADGSKASTTFNAATATCWDTTPATSTSPSTTIFGTPTFADAYAPAEYYNAANNTDVTVVVGSKVYGFQSFAGNLPHVILLVKGEYATGYYTGTAKYFMGYVTFTKYNDGASYIASMDANKIYKIGTGATGIVISADIITPKPEMEMYDLAIDVTVTPWTEINVTPEI